MKNEILKQKLILIYECMQYACKYGSRLSAHRLDHLIVYFGRLYVIEKKKTIQV